MNKLPSIRISSLSEEPPLQASKWISVQMLLDADEMRALFDALGPFHIYSVGTVVSRGEESLERETFLKLYQEYVEALQKGELPDDSAYRRAFAAVLTVTPDALYAIPVEENKLLVRVAKPVIQMQAHRMDYSRADGKFRSMTFGGDSITWGLQFAYPQLYQDGKTKEIHQVGSGDEYPNTALFRTLQLWVRNHTIPTPFIVDGQKMHLPVRIGKKCLNWINSHPQLAKKGISV